MNANKSHNLLLLVLVFMSICVSGQISKKGVPYSFNRVVPIQKQVVKKVLPLIDTVLLKKQDEDDEKNGIPPRFGNIFPVNYTTINSGIWTELSDGSRLWQLTIVCKNAISINLLYDKFWLPDSAELFIYNKDKTHIIGAFSSLNNSGTMQNPEGFATGLVYGDEITLEYREPKNYLGHGIISISGVVHGYRKIKMLEESIDKNFNDSGNCNKNVNCVGGWEKQKKGVALIIVNGNRWCTGCLINNTNQDGTPYFLTANHCLTSSNLDAITNPNANNWTFMWNYESPLCNTNQDVNNLLVTARAVVVANNSISDFALLKLVEKPSDMTTYYSGWDRTGFVPTSVTCIHHPRGDVKKISIDNHSPSITGYPSGYCQITPNGTTHWKTVWDYGVTEGGSSGSPLFDPYYRIIGQLHGGYSSCQSTSCTGPNFPDFYGRLSVSWNNSSDPRRRLKDWLDPNNNGIVVLDGIDGLEIFLDFPNNCSVTTVQNQIVTTNSTITNCGISVQNVTVQNNVKLTLDATLKTVINGPFQVKQGATLEIK